MVPAMAEYSIMAMTLMVRPPMIDGTASDNCVVVTCSVEPPDARATSTTDVGTERREFSTMRVKNAMPANDIGTTAAAIPMLVPVIQRVTGTNAAIKIRNG